MSNSQAPRTLSELANAYYAEMKTTIGKDEPLFGVFQDVQRAPYFISAENRYFSDNDEPVLWRQFIFRSDEPRDINILALSRPIHNLAYKEGLKVICTVDEDNVLTVLPRDGQNVEQFQSFVKGLGILLRAATQHKREAGYAAPAAEM